MIFDSFNPKRVLIPRSSAVSVNVTSISNFSVQVPAGTHTITLLARNDGYNEVINHLAAVYLTALVVPVN